MRLFLTRNLLLLWSTEYRHCFMIPHLLRERFFSLGVRWSTVEEEITRDKLVTKRGGIVPELLPLH